MIKVGLVLLLMLLMVACTPPRSQPQDVPASVAHIPNIRVETFYNNDNNRAMNEFLGDDKIEVFLIQSIRGQMIDSYHIWYVRQGGVSDKNR